MSLLTVLQTAIADPTRANLRSLLQAFDAEIANQSDREQFQTAGEVIVRLAELIELRAKVWLADWDDRHQPPSPEEPLLTADMLQDVLRQTMTLNLEELLESPDRKVRAASDSMVSSVEKETLMQFVDELEQAQAKQEALAIAYAEDISQWVAQIRQWLPPEAVSLTELVQQMPLPWAQIWLALLLGGFHLEQTGAFYDAATLTVQCPPSAPL